MHEAIEVAIKEIEEMGIGKRQINYKMRDAGWSRQRYWGEPFPVVFKDDMPYPMKESELPLELPDSNNFKPSGNGEGPLANLKEWINFSPNAKRDSNTMPTHAGAAWYFLRYMDPHNKNAFADKKALDYWNQVDVYIGGSEHAVAHLLYSRLWTKVLCDLGYLNFDEPFKKLINQGKITGVSEKIFWVTDWNEKDGSGIENFGNFVRSIIQKKSIDGSKVFVSEDVVNTYSLEPNCVLMHVPIEFVKSSILNIQELIDSPFAKGREIDNGTYISSSRIVTDRVSYGEIASEFKTVAEIEKMSKSYFNVVNPDDVIGSYGADTLRMYEMFLGPLEASKPWSTQGIDGVFKFLRRFWNLFHDAQGNWNVSDIEPTREELKALHKVIKKVQWDIENFSFNTSVSEFMICANELSSLKCNKRAVLEPLTIVLASYAPHITEELWEKLGHKDSILNASYPAFNEDYLKENAFEYPISINGKVRAKMNFALDMPKEDIEKLVLASEAVQKWSEGKAPKKVIIVPGKIVNIVL